MNCKFCNRPISHTFASFFSQREIHLKCENLLKKEHHIVAFPFLEGLIMVGYLLEEVRKELDQAYFIRNYMNDLIVWAVSQGTLVLFLDSEIEQDDLYLIFLLAQQRLCWVFLAKPTFLE